MNLMQLKSFYSESYRRLCSNPYILSKFISWRECQMFLILSEQLKFNNYYLKYFRGGFRLVMDSCNMLRTGFRSNKILLVSLIYIEYCFWNLYSSEFDLSSKSSSYGFFEPLIITFQASFLNFLYRNCSNDIPCVSYCFFENEEVYCTLCLGVCIYYSLIVPCKGLSNADIYIN